MADRDQQVLTERIAGSPLAAIAQRHDLSPEGVRVVVAREGRRQIEQLVLAIWAAQKAGQILALAVPAGLDADQQLAVAYLHWVLGELRDYGVAPRVHYRPALDGGFVFALEDESFKPDPVVQEDK